MRLPFRCLASLVIVIGSLAGGVAEAQTASPPPDWRERFRAHDRNDDGRIDRAEFQEWMVDAFFQRDQGKKGYLTMEDVRGVMTPEIFKALNQRGDGKLWLPEYLNALFQDFLAMDTGGEGSVTMEEVDAYVRRALR
jgi:Ca2+-binding EF-hand superfamily protein